MAGHVSGGSQEHERLQDRQMSGISVSSFECVVTEQLAIKELDGPHSGHKTARTRRTENYEK